MAEYLRVMPRYGLTRGQIDRAQRLRADGDWAGACAAAGIAVEVQGSDLPPADLPYFAPDLLRWHSMRLRHHQRLNYTSHELRDRGGELTLPIWLGPDGTHAIGLGVRSVPPYQSRLFIAKPGEFSPGASLDAAPQYWDVRHAGDLLTRCGGGGPHAEHVYALLAAGRITEAWTAAGFEVDPHTHHSTNKREHLFGRHLLWNLGEFTPALPVLAATARDWALARGHTAVWLTVERSEPVMIVLDRLDTDRPRLRGEWVGSPWLAGVPRLPVMLQDRPPDWIDLVAGQVGAADLHPLVASALVPHEPATGPRALRMPGPAVVDCDGEQHEVVARDGTLVVPHPAAEIERELALRAMGGPVPPGCAGVVYGWRTGIYEVPEPLHSFQRELDERIRYGEVETVAELIAAGLDPAMRLRDGRSLHYFRSKQQ
ncbi:hypothetical protein ACQP00_34275 [Dactylosporangium sp. CS-047395]|uniref:hypothetical protein n=1 Tax=Dactylosporangium sp. CS-047395 TaxID=3239936 RepID=UPI003D907127